MLMSTEDARKKWCPEARAIEAERDKTCRASDCMAWRWAGYRTKTLGYIAPEPYPDERVGPRLGFCGLAGQPAFIDDEEDR